MSTKSCSDYDFLIIDFVLYTLRITINPIVAKLKFIMSLNLERHNQNAENI